MYTFQLLPDKGWSIATNLQWVGLTVAVYLGWSMKDDPKFFLDVFSVFPACMVLQLVALGCFGKEVQGLTELQI
jgi:hypothetical protein